MIPVWLSSRFHRVRNRQDNHETLSESSTPTTSSASSTSSTETKPPPRQSRRRRSSSKSNKLSKEMLKLLTGIIRPKLEQAAVDGLLEEHEAGLESCVGCLKRVAKFRCDPCGHSLCKLCAYTTLMDGIVTYKEGPLTGECVECHRLVNGFIKLRKCRRMHDDLPPDENSQEQEPSVTVSFNDYAESFLRESDKSGRVNRAFESSNSL